MRSIKEILKGDVPDDVCDWIVEFHEELEERRVHLTPEQAFEFALAAVKHDPVALVTHVRSGLIWDVRFRDGKLESTEVTIHIRKEVS